MTTRPTNDLMAGQYEDVENENERLRKEVLLLCHPVSVLVKPAFQCPVAASLP